MDWGHLYIQVMHYVQVPVMPALTQIEEDTVSCPYQGAPRVESELCRLPLLINHNGILA